MRRVAAFCLFASTLVAGCHWKRSPPPSPAASVSPIPSAAPVVSAPVVKPAAAAFSSYHYIQAIGVNDTSILISVDVGSSRSSKPTTDVPAPAGLTAQTIYYVVDLTSGCVLKTEQFPMVDEAASRSAPFSEMREEDAVGPPRVLPILNSPIFHEQFVREQKLFADFAANADGHAAWSQDGTRALFAADDQMYRSDDGIRFSVIDVNASYTPKLTNDGRFGIYKRCTHPCGTYRLAQIALGHASPPRFVTGPEIHDCAFDVDQKSAVYAREDKAKNQICIERVALDTGKIGNVACEPTSEVISEDVLTMSRGTTFGALETFGAKPPGTPHLVIFDLSSGARVRSLDVMSNVPPVDDDGRVALDDVPNIDATRVADDSGFHSLGSGEAMAWDHAKRVVLLHRNALAEPSTCGVVTAVAPTP